MIGQRGTGRLGTLWDRTEKLWRILTNSMYRRALRLGTAASTEHSGVPFPDQLSSIIDVGANRGQFAVFARERWPLATIEAFEPHPAAAARLRRLFDGDQRVRVYELAASAKTGLATLHLSNQDDSSSLRRVGRRYLDVWPSTFPVGECEVSIGRIDEVLDSPLPRPSLLKIDVQGTELEVLWGAEGLIQETDLVFVECSFVELYEGQALAGEVIAWLEDRGLTLRGTYTAAYAKGGVCLQADLLFSRLPVPLGSP